MFNTTSSDIERIEQAVYVDTFAAAPPALLPLQPSVMHDVGRNSARRASSGRTDCADCPPVAGSVRAWVPIGGCGNLRDDTGAAWHLMS
jgi:hypothetical protein